MNNTEDDMKEATDETKTGGDGLNWLKRFVSWFFRVGKRVIVGCFAIGVMLSAFTVTGVSSMLEFEWMACKAESVMEWAEDLLDSLS